MQHPAYTAAIITVFATLAVTLADNSHGFNGYKLLAISPDTAQHIEYLDGLRKSVETLGLEDEIDFWNEASVITQKSKVMLMVAPKRLDHVVAALNDQHLPFEVTIEDIAQAIQEESRMSPADRVAEAQNRLTWTAYHRPAIIETFVRNLAQQYPSLVTLTVLGKSYEGRDIFLLKIGKERADGRKKPIVWMDSHIHAREWITSATTTWMINKLVTEYGHNATSTRLLDSLDFLYVPIVNPDGVEHTHTDYRMWRKTRSVNPFSECIGTDPNRNYDHMWMVAGASQSPCGDTFAGPWPLSEIENIYLADAALQYKGQIKAFLTVHSAAQMWLFPWGYGLVYPDDQADLVRMGNRAVDALYSQYRTSYRVGSSTALLGPGAGGTDDWGKAKALAKYSYTLELRDNGMYSFLLPPQFIIPSGVETFEALIVVSDMVLEEFGATVE